MKLIRSADQFAGRDVLIMGLGTKDGGVGATRFALRHGARVTVTDVQSAEQLTRSVAALGDLPVRLRLGGHEPGDFEAADIVLRNPGIRRSHPLLRRAAQRGAIVDSPIGVFCELVSTPYIGITGTKGKSLTTHLVQHLLQHAGMHAVAVGNNCVSPLRHLACCSHHVEQSPGGSAEKIRADVQPLCADGETYSPDASAPALVLELSSWQLGEMGLHGRSPRVACWLNMFADHMNHYDDLEAYWRDKANVTRYQDEGDVLVVPAEATALAHLPSRANKVFFSTERDLRGAASPACVLAGDRILWHREGRSHPLLPIGELPPALSAPHHLPLVLAACACACVYGCPPAAIGPALRCFAGIPHRFERLPRVRRIDCINDSAATTPESVELAIAAVSRRPLVLIFGGGGHKELSYDRLAQTIAADVDQLILFERDAASQRLAALLPSAGKHPVIAVDAMRCAVEAGLGFLCASGGGSLLLSPGCSGAPFFRDLFDRGEQFKACVREALSKD